MNQMTIAKAKERFEKSNPVSGRKAIDIIVGTDDRQQPFSLLVRASSIREIASEIDALCRLLGGGVTVAYNMARGSRPAKGMARLNFWQQRDDGEWDEFGFFVEAADEMAAQRSAVEILSRLPYEAGIEVEYMML